MPVQISVEEVQRLRARLKEINSIPLDKIEWTVNNAPVQINPLLVADCCFAGLNNTEFCSWFMDSRVFSILSTATTMWDVVDHYTRKKNNGT